MVVGPSNRFIQKFRLGALECVTGVVLQEAVGYPRQAVLEAELNFLGECQAWVHLLGLRARNRLGRGGI